MCRIRVYHKIWEKRKPSRRGRSCRCSYSEAAEDIGLLLTENVVIAVKGVIVLSGDAVEDKGAGVRRIPAADDAPDMPDKVAVVIHREISAGR